MGTKDLNTRKVKYLTVRNNLLKFQSLATSWENFKFWKKMKMKIWKKWMYTFSLFKWFFAPILLKWRKNHKSPHPPDFPIFNLNYRYWWQASRRRSCWNSSSTSADRSSFVQRRCCRTGGAPSRDDGKRHHQSHDRLTGRDRPPSVQGIQPRPANGTCIISHVYSIANLFSTTQKSIDAEMTNGTPFPFVI